MHLKGFGSLEKIVLSTSCFFLALFASPFVYAGMRPYVFLTNSMAARDVVNIAIARKQPELCGKISIIFELFGPTEEDIRQRCFSETAIALRDEEICKNVENYPFECFSQIALLKKQPSVCDTISDNEDKGMCYMQLVMEIGEERLCSDLKEPSVRDTCYFGYARKTKDNSICKKFILDPHKKTMCFDIVSNL